MKRKFILIYYTVNLLHNMFALIVAIEALNYLHMR